ncbi:DUF6230 family protein [Xylanimonas protaetiae]|uniref:Cholesterol esterase n=1 Tax=Xylanimonas protaetiae TaxID=2509457 RepID=A0A4P6FH33_9MICO|nr:DUF6230 family protein [Xylanimonas protaetiae]QAY69928.1 cholesterol esterase [Xylanimonas protaetiae]
MKLSSLTRTRGGRVLLVTVPTVAALAFTGTAVAQGVVQVSMSVSGQEFTISADKLEGTDFSQYAGVALETDKTKQHPVAIANIGHATLTNLCQSIKTPFGPSLLIHAGTKPGRPAEADGLQIGMDNLSGTARFENIRIGVDASTVVTAARGNVNDFAMDSTKVTIDNLHQVAYSTQAATFTLTDLELGINLAGEECP